MEKLHIEKNTLQETLVIPLYARKLCTQMFPNIYQDHSAEELIDRLDYDFAAVAAKSGKLVQKFGSLEVGMRENDLAMEVEAYLREHPRAAVVSMGCGLDQIGERCDNGQCRMYNLDLPDVIAVRNQLLPPGERTENLGADMLDTEWFRRIDASQGVVFFGAGVFYYFHTEDLQKLFNAMAEEFPGGRLVMDTCNQKGLKLMLKVVSEEAGIQDISGFFHVNDIDQDVRPWLRHARASGKPYMLGYNDLKDPSVSRFFRFLARTGDKKFGMQILRLDFDGKN